jgi:hypothetical protein
LAIIISFVFFFGYSALSTMSPEGDGIVATVNGEPVTTAEFNYFFEANVGQMKENFKDTEIPAFLMTMAEQNTMQQMVARALVVKNAKNLGIVIPDRELADIIVKSQQMMSGGEFDPVFYRQRYLPHFKNRYGLDYEEFVRRDLTVAAYNQMFETVDAKPLFKKDDALNSEGSSWTFEIVEFNLDAAEKAQELAGTPPSKWKSKLKNSNGKTSTAGPVTISERQKLPAFAKNVEKARALFSLTKAAPVTVSPIEDGEKIYVARLVEKSELQDDKKQEIATGDFFRTWMTKLLANAQVKNQFDQTEK